MSAKSWAVSPVAAASAMAGKGSLTRRPARRAPSNEQESFLCFLAEFGDRRAADIPVPGRNIFEDDPDVVSRQLQHVADGVDDALRNLVLPFLRTTSDEADVHERHCILLLGVRTLTESTCGRFCTRSASLS